ncbi:RNA-binding protein 12B-like [Physella acuta]|uniref:RNA-binding protein 12B-like n=1 Tax=Physella acuta TaxID=109671 RepID=UPI0027DD6BE6|nr:RNA-binding protein 12B-like [Physella acuta]
MAVQVLLHLVAFALLNVCVESWRCAKYENYFSQQPDYIDCLWDCCGNSFNRHCCAPIGIIVGVCIVGAVAVAALVVVVICWWQRKRSQYNAGPKLFHNKRHSHYPVAPTSVTRPAPVVSYGGPPPQQQYRQGPPKEKVPIDEYEKRGPPSDAYQPWPGQGVMRPPPDEYEDKDSSFDSRAAPPPGGYRPPPNRGQRPPPDEYDM